MKFSVLCVGKIKEHFYRDAVAEYAKRLSRYGKLEILEVADEKTPDEPSEAQRLQILKREGERLKKHLEKDAFHVALAIDGKKMDSVRFAARLEQLGVSGISHIQFLIGGSLGLDQELLDGADLKLSFSDMTFPHQLMRVILLEQIYRAQRITNGEPYHK
ncbi:MAG TPA: 23S rRNA (pseudouridine(1915)-N(3))-methyltransferase RlmH [Candidatus Eisenbergiella intestinipullorum]|nr:23S rRNA (pseudouridine(1915)-N(3))-methyltransferase RlmH [Candidatus Eisenbergiella intestinipullorum]